jgi:hypothetical protein
MNEPPPGFIRTPTPLAATLIALSVLPLPAESRERWSDECRAEIVELHRIRQVTVAASSLAGSFALRAALKADSENPAMSINLSCRIGRHHYRTVNQDNPENRGYQYRECIMCGKTKEGTAPDFPRSDRPFMGGGGIAN